MKKFLLIIAGIIILGSAAHAATVCFPFQGCTGTGTAPRAGQVLIGTSTSTYTPAYLTAGSNITISTSSGAITISASGSGGSGGGTTTTINGVNGPAFTFNVAGINGLSYSTSTGVITITQVTSSASQAGFLSAADWTTFNAKQSALSFGNLTETGSSILTITGGTGAVVGSGTTVQVKQASSTQSGFLSSTDWSTFNNKQAAGNYITALTGDGSASGPGSSAFILATVNSNVGTFGSSTVIPRITVNAKGLITAVSTTTVSEVATTTINGVNGPTFTFATSTDSNIQITISTSTGIITFNPAWSGVLGATRGGTDNDTYVTGDMLFADGANHLARLAVGSDGQYLGVSSGVPAWQSTPGNDTYVLFNDGGAFGGDSRFIWNKATSGGLSVTAPDGAVDPASIGGRTDFVSGNGGDNIDQYYTGSQFSLTGGDGDEQRGGSIGGAAGSSVIDGDGGPVSFQAGNGGTNSGSGGPVSLIAGDAQGGDGDGGNIQIQSGDKNGSGDSGYVLLSTPNNEKQLYLQEGYGFAIYTGGSANALLSASDLNSDRTFSFPDHEGAFVISTTTPTTASDTCSPGQVSYSSTHFYVCVATDTWKRAALSTF